MLGGENQIVVLPNLTYSITMDGTQEDVWDGSNWKI